MIRRMKSQSPPGFQIHFAPDSELMSRWDVANRTRQLNRLVNVPLSKQCPASFRQLHPNLTVVCDAAAAGGLQ
jgi:hypothetical protein